MILELCNSYVEVDTEIEKRLNISDLKMKYRYLMEYMGCTSLPVGHDNITLEEAYKIAIESMLDGTWRLLQ